MTRPPTIRMPRARAGRRIGVLGGSFNPAHAGHLHISRLALRALALDEVWWLVTPRNPLKSAVGMAPLRDRLAGAEAAAAADRRIVVTGLETRLATRYTADTLLALGRRYPGVRFVWLMGADNLLQISRWHRWPVIFRSVPIAVFDRSDYAFRALAGPGARRFRRHRRRGAAVRGLAAAAAPAWAFIRGGKHGASATALRTD